MSTNKHGSRSRTGKKYTPSLDVPDSVKMRSLLLFTVLHCSGKVCRHHVNWQKKGNEIRSQKWTPISNARREAGQFEVYTAEKITATRKFVDQKRYSRKSKMQLYPYCRRKTAFSVGEASVSTKNATSSWPRRRRPRKSDAKGLTLNSIKFKRPNFSTRNLYNLSTGARTKY